MIFDYVFYFFFFFQAEDGIRDLTVTGVQTCALPIYFKKIVPVVFETGLPNDRAIPWSYLIRRLAAVPAHMTVYGYAYQHDALAGATSEMLFATDGRGYQTMALAGTRPIDRASELLRDTKELREHRLVVEDIVRRVAPFGNVEVEPLRIVELPS